ncbi:alpha/beta fold hydrolase [Arsukibacterium sp.]|uniref:alpha/beta fold hydrolase n=1 Tax=Arsukibacterium sp. TaxID=1977258 RepID=UPI002602C7ED|nr:alpha/beta fold hydrolase [Arsukibacterium sp.]
MVEFTWQGFEHSVLRQGRDLLLMDPRGTGMAQPRLDCPSIVSYGLQQLNQRQLQPEQSSVEDQILRECIARLQQQGVDVAQYNSKSVVEDLKLLQQALQLEQWSLFGVSYGAVYALLYTNEAPEHVETLILDSPAFPAVKNVENPAGRFMATFQQLENYCQFDDACTEPLPDFPERLWQLAEKLDLQPLTVSIPSGFFGMNIPVQLSGEMFLNLLAWAAYDNAIYRELPQIVTALEQGNVSPFYEYVDSYVSYIKDNDFSVVSMASHLCFDEVPFMDYIKLKQSFSELPEGFLRDAGLSAYQWPASLCPVFGPGNSGNEIMVKQTLTSIPTLFLQGILDTVTPLEDVKQQMPFFSRSQLRVYPLSHGVHGRLDCVDKDLAVFLSAPQQVAQPAACQLN